MSNGPPAQAEAWFPLVYDCLRDLAERWYRREAPGNTLQPTAFVHEAYLRLARSGAIDCRDETHFLAVAATAMRHVIVDHARRRGAARRGGGHAPLSLQDADAVFSEGSVDVLVLDEALGRLADEHERAARVVELRFFSGLTVDETAEVLGVSSRTIDLDWRFARAWLMRTLDPEGSR